MVLFFEISMWISVLPCLISIVASSSAVVDASTATPLISFFPSLPAAPSQFPTRLSKSLSKMKRLTHRFRALAEPLAPRFLLLAATLILIKSVSGALLLVGLALAFFSSLRCCCSSSSVVVSFVFLSSNFFFVSTFSKHFKKKIQKYQQRESIFLCTITRNAPLRELAQKTKSRLGEQGSLGSLGWRLWNQRPKHTKGRKESHLKRDLGIYS